MGTYRALAMGLAAISGLAVAAFPRAYAGPGQVSPPASGTMPLGEALMAPPPPDSQAAPRRDSAAPKGIPAPAAMAAGIESQADRAGMDCEAPEFAFKRLTPRTFILFARAKRPGRFRLAVIALDDGRRAPGTPKYRPLDDTLALIDTATAEPDPGSAYDIFFPSLARIISKGGRVRVAYRYVGGGASCSERAEGFRLVTVVPEHELDLDAGMAYNLEKDGHWDGAGEFGVHGLSRWNTWFTGVLDFRFASIGRIDSGADSGSGTDLRNPFQSRAGSLGLNLSLETSPGWHRRHRNPAWFYPFFLVTGFGLTSPPGPSLEITQVRPRLAFGLGARVDDYSLAGGTLEQPNTTGCVRLLVAYDRFWAWQDSVPGAAAVADYRNYWRFVGEGELEIPGVGGKNVKPALRGFIDFPLASIPGLGYRAIGPAASGGFPAKPGPSRVSLSLLVHLQQEALETLFSPR